MATKNSYAELLKKKEDLEAQLEVARAAEVQDAVAQVREIIETFGLTPADLGFRGFAGRGGAKRTTPPVVKYRDKKTGGEWSGRGKRPRWLNEALEAGKTLESFYVGDK